MKESSVLTIYSTGDRSVGIQPVEVKVEFSHTFDRDEREVLQKQLVEVLANYYDDICWGIWDDQCPDCGRDAYANGVCGHLDCVSNVPTEGV